MVQFLRGFLSFRGLRHGPDGAGPERVEGAAARHRRRRVRPGVLRGDLAAGMRALPRSFESALRDEGRGGAAEQRGREGPGELPGEGGGVAPGGHGRGREQGPRRRERRGQGLRGEEEGALGEALRKLCVGSAPGSRCGSRAGGGAARQASFERRESLEPGDSRHSRAPRAGKRPAASQTPLRGGRTLSGGKPISARPSRPAPPGCCFLSLATWTRRDARAPPLRRSGC